MNATLRDRLVLVEQLFLIAVISQDEMALEKISLELPRLIYHFKDVEANGDLDDYTALLLSRVSQVITATTQCMLGCEDILKDARTGIIRCFTLPLPSDDLVPVSTSSPTSTPYPLLFSHVSSSGTLGQNKLLDACAYRWLMQNMHNPYPTPTQLRSICDESMTSVAQVDLWFQEARDLIGWTTLSDEFFAGSLNATKNAAEQVYLEHDNTLPFCITLAFSKVKAFMETLFAEHLALPTPLTSQVEGPAQAVPVVYDSIYSHDLLDDEKDEEDTTPPPTVAGCKRKLPEDTATSLVSDLHRPLKRLRAQPLHQNHSRSECMHPSSNTGSFKKSATEALIHTSAIPVVQLSDPSFLVGSKPSPDSLAFDSTAQRPTDLYGSASEMVIVSPDPPVAEVKVQRIPEGSLLVPSERQLSPSANHRRHPSPGFVPTFAWPMAPLGHPPTNFTGASQVTVSPGAPVDLSVFDWNSTPNPLIETAILTNQPASFYVPGSDLAAMNYVLPDPLYVEQSAEQQYNPPYSLDDLGSLDDFSLLQFPVPTTLPTDVSASPSASFCSDNFTLPSLEMDCSAITDFINQFSSFSAQTSSAHSPSATIDAVPSTPENPISSLFPPPPYEIDKPISVLDPSIPPSAFLPTEPGIFADDPSSMWSLLCGLS